MIFTGQMKNDKKEILIKNKKPKEEGKGRELYTKYKMV